MVPEEFVVRFVDKIRHLVAEMDVSFFEITVAMAFQYFAEEKVDIAVIEVGLGGRLDSTNIISPLLSIITNISYDHTNMLGNTLTQIATEKAGIIKYNTPVVIGEKNSETNTVFERTAKEISAPIYFAEDNLKVLDYKVDLKEINIDVTNTHTLKKESYSLDLPGIYQTKNIITVLQAVSLLQNLGYSVSEENIKKGLSSVKSLTGLQGRWEVISIKPLIVLEVAHNEDGVKQMINHLDKIHFHKLHLIIGAVKDKDVSKILELLPKDAHFYFTQAHIPRALEASSLQSQAKNFGLVGEACSDVNKAIKKASSVAEADDLILVCGSIFLVAEVKKNLFQNQ
jgi:dihydrofolate synthase/folylpolyglutamate synthase